MKNALAIGLLLVIPAVAVGAALLFLPVYQATNMFHAAKPRGDAAETCALGKAALAAWDASGISASKALQSEVKGECLGADLEALRKKSEMAN